MTKKEFIVVSLLFLGIVVFFFYKTFIYGHVPFPGDLLIAEYNPWKSYSYLGYLPGSYPNKAQYFDTLRQLYPWKTLAFSLVKHGVFPLWNPYNFSGSPLFANFQSSVIYPLNFVYLFLPQILGWTILVITQVFFSGLFTYLFARKIGQHKVSSFFASFAYSTCSFMVVWLEYNTIGHVMALLPLTLLSIEYLLEKSKSIKWSIIFIVSIVCSALAGHPQLFGYSLVFTFIYLIFRKGVSKHMVVLYVLSLGICAVQYFPGIELIKNAARSAHDYTTIMTKELIQGKELVMLFVSDFFGNPATRNYIISDTYVGKMTSIGLVPLLFVFLSFKLWKNSFVKFFSFSALATLALATSNPITYVLYALKLPVLSSSSPTLAVFIFCFSLSMLAGFGLQIFQKNNLSFKKALIWLCPVVLFFTLLAVVSFHSIKLELIVLSLSVVSVMFSVIRPKYKFVSITILLFLTIISSWRSFQKFNPFVPVGLVFPKAEVISILKQKSGIDRAWSFGGATIEANFATQEGFYSPEGYDPLYPMTYGKFIGSSTNGQIQTTFNDQTRSDAVIAKASASDFFTNSNRLKVLSLLGVKFIVDRAENGSTAKTFPPSEFSLVYDKAGWKILENRGATPRFFLTTNYKTYSSSNDFSHLFFDKNFSTKTLLLEKNIPEKLDATTMHSSLISYSPQNLSVQTKSDGNSLLFLSDTYYPGWVATIDGKQVDIIKADYSFRSVVVPRGVHKIVFTFQSDSFKIGSMVSLVSLLALAVYLFMISMKEIQLRYEK